MKKLNEQIKKIIGYEAYCSNSVDDTCVCDCGALKLAEQILEAVRKRDAYVIGEYERDKNLKYSIDELKAKYRNKLRAEQRQRAEEETR